MEQKPREDRGRVDIGNVQTRSRGNHKLIQRQQVSSISPTQDIFITLVFRERGKGEKKQLEEKKMDAILAKPGSGGWSGEAGE